MFQLEEECYSIVELQISWEKEICIHVELGNFIFFLIWFGVVLYINRLFEINENTIFPSINYDYIYIRRDRITLYIHSIRNVFFSSIISHGIKAMEGSG